MGLSTYSSTGDQIVFVSEKPLCELLANAVVFAMRFDKCKFSTRNQFQKYLFCHKLIFPKSSYSYVDYIAFSKTFFCGIQRLLEVVDKIFPSCHTVLISLERKHCPSCIQISTVIHSETGRSRGLFVFLVCQLLFSDGSLRLLHFNSSSVFQCLQLLAKCCIKTGRCANASHASNMSVIK